MVANIIKYLAGQPLVGHNPEPSRWDGVLLPFRPADLGAILPSIAADLRDTRSVTMAEARLSDGQVLRAVNDLFIGPRIHPSALYDLSHGSKSEFQSSSGLILSTGLSSTDWLKSIVTGSLAIARTLCMQCGLPAHALGKAGAGVCRAGAVSDTDLTDRTVVRAGASR